MEEQPSPLLRFPSSQGKVKTRPSPHISEHVEIWIKEPPEHEKPVYYWQIEEHPSPSNVFPSSHSSLTKIPSPQSSIQASCPKTLPLGVEYPVEQ